MSDIGSIADTIGRRDNLFPLRRAQWCHHDAQGLSVLYRAETSADNGTRFDVWNLCPKKISRKLFERSRLGHGSSWLGRAITNDWL